MAKVGPSDLDEIVKRGLEQEILLIERIEGINLFLKINNDGIFRLEFVKPLNQYEGHDRVFKIYIKNKLIGFYVIELESVDNSRHSIRWVSSKQIIRSYFMYGLTMPIRKIFNKFDGFLKFALEVDSFWFAPKIIIDKYGIETTYPNESGEVKPDNEWFMSLNFGVLDELPITTQKHIFIDGSTYDKYMSYYKENTSKIYMRDGVIRDREKTLPKINEPYDKLLNYIIKCALIKGDKTNLTNNLGLYMETYGNKF